MQLRLGDHVSTAETDYGTILLDQRSGDYWELNPTAALVIEVLAADGSAERAAEVLAERFEVAPAQARQDVTGLVDELRAAGLVG